MTLFDYLNQHSVIVLVLGLATLFLADNCIVAWSKAFLVKWAPREGCDCVPCDCTNAEETEVAEPSSAESLKKGTE